MKFKFGDWVIYNPGYKSEIGRVTECHGDRAHVCYHEGCTAACTPIEFLRLASEDEMASASSMIGYHRFDKTCPDRNDDYCSMCKAKKE